MPANNRQAYKRLLVVIETIGEHYWLVLLVGLAVFASSAAYGYFAEQRELMLFGLYGAIIFVLAPPAILMSSYLLSRLFDLFRKP